MFSNLSEWLAAINIPQFSLPEIGLTEIIDIVIVAYLLYIIVRWIRQTRAWSLFKGIVIILMVAVFAYLFDLVTVLWILQNAYAMGLIAVVILFQPELRKALEQIGRNRLLSSFAKQENDNYRISVRAVNEVVKAAKAMSAVKTGALIVLENEMSLAEYERTGIALDAVISNQLLVNIFEKNTPLHDGAVIIRQTRVVAATCILPLTAEDISRELGTRHRAALGMSEVCDALVTVVSEETGRISVAMGGKLVRDLNEYQLRDILLQGDRREKPRFSLFKPRRGAS